MDKNIERRILLDRFFRNDRYLYIVGKNSGIEFFDQLDERFAVKGYVVLSKEEREKAIVELANRISDEDLIKFSNPIITGETIYPEIDRFIGEHYYCTLRTGIRAENRQPFMIDELEDFLRVTNRRTVMFLTAMIQLYHEKEKTRTYHGDSYIDIVNKIREKYEEYIPEQTDLSVMKSEPFYAQIGGKKSPTHIIPEEMIPAVEKALSKRILV